MTLEEMMKEFPEEGSQPGNEAAISLHDLLARGTAVNWDEAVAIVEEMCEVAIATSGEKAPVPSLADVLLDANGRLTLSRQGHGEKSPTAAGRALHALLANASVPMPLRLFVTQSTAPETYGSLGAFAAGLAYFGRPNRTELIQNVYKRAADLGDRASRRPRRRQCLSRRRNRRRSLRNRRDRTTDVCCYGLPRSCWSPSRAVRHGVGGAQVHAARQQRAPTESCRRRRPR